MPITQSPVGGGASVAGIAAYGNGITNGVETMPRGEAASLTTGISSGGLRFSFFTPATSVTVTKIRTYTGGTAAAATPTLCRVGFYTVVGDTLTLVCAIASDTTLWATINTGYTRDLSTGGGLPASYNFIAGTRYAAGLICVSGAATPTFFGQSTLNAGAGLLPPVINGLLASQTDLLASTSVSGLSATSARIYVAGTAT